MDISEIICVAKLDIKISHNRKEEAIWASLFRKMVRLQVVI